MDKEQYKVGSNRYKCPICGVVKSSKGFTQHVNNHNRVRDLSAFRASAAAHNKEEYELKVASYNRNPNHCLQCGSPILAKPGSKLHVVKSRKFCSQRCAAVYNNTRRSPEVRERQRASLLKTLSTHTLHYSNPDGSLRVVTPVLEKVCPTCGKIFKPGRSSQRCCSRSCAHPLPTKADLITWVYSFVQEHGYIPTSKISMKHHTAATKYFGSWNKMMLELGYTPYTQKYGKKVYKSKDGHISDSLAEVLIDNWLFDHNVAHERRRKYPNSKRNCDFYLVDYGVWLEYFGLAGEIKEYDEAIEEKRRLAKENDLPLVEIFADDLFPDFKLEAKVKDILDS